MHLLLRSKHIAPKPRIARAPELVKSFLLNGISFVVRSFVRSFVRSLVSALSFCTALQSALYSSVVRTYAVDKKADHGHKKGHAPQALPRHRHYTRHPSTGTSRPRTKGHGAPHQTNCT